MKRLVLLVILVAGALARRAEAWWESGHEIVALIAWNDLTPEAKAKVIRLLRAHPDFQAMLTKEQTPEAEKDREAFLTGSIWPDLIKVPNNRSIKYNHPIWHYVDIPFVVGELKSEPPMPDMKWNPEKEPVNAAQAYAKCIADLGNEKLSDAERGIALAWIEHLAGDLHQPLHTAAWFSATLPQGDQGGNLLIVRSGNQVTNLHSLWDGLLGGSQPFPAIQELSQNLAKAHPRMEFLEQLAAKDVEIWIQARSEEARKYVYLEGTLAWITRDEQSRDHGRPVPELPAGYMDNAKALARKNVVLAGYRLADQLNDLLGK